jgi:hypothetical protein
MHDKTIYQLGLQQMIPKGKLVIANGGYKGSDEIAIPNAKIQNPGATSKVRPAFGMKHLTVG